MKKSTIEVIEKEINEKTKLSEDVKQKIMKDVFINMIILIFICAYLIFIVLGGTDFISNVKILDCSALSILNFVILGIAIVLLEIAYKKDSGKYAAFGMEFLAIAVFTLFIPYVTSNLNISRDTYCVIASAVASIYYPIKSICIYRVTKKNYMKQSNDINEIIKKEPVKKQIIEDKEEITTSNEDDIIENKTTKTKSVSKGRKKTETVAKTKKTKEVESEKSELPKAKAVSKGRKKTETTSKTKKAKETEGKKSELPKSAAVSRGRKKTGTASKPKKTKETESKKSELPKSAAVSRGRKKAETASKPKKTKETENKKSELPKSAAVSRGRKKKTAESSNK